MIKIFEREFRFFGDTSANIDRYVLTKATWKNKKNKKKPIALT